MDEAAKVLQQAKGWGSAVEVGIVAHRIPLQDYLPLLKSISENPWLRLSFVEGRPLDSMTANIKKSIEAGAGQLAPRSESDSGGDDRSQPESEGRSR